MDGWMDGWMDVCAFMFDHLLLACTCLCTCFHFCADMRMVTGGEGGGVARGVVEDVCLGPTCCGSCRPSVSCSGSVLVDFLRRAALCCAASQVWGRKLARRCVCLSTWGPFPYGTSLRDHVPEHAWDPSESVSAQSSSGQSKSVENRQLP